MRFNVFLAATLAVTAVTALEASARQRFVSYEQFGAKGDGVTDDMPAIVAAHAYANEKGLSVKAKNGKTYFIGNAPLTAEIRTGHRRGRGQRVARERSAERRYRRLPSFCAWEGRGYT